MTYYVGTIPCGSNGLSHFGIKGMKWGVRRTPEQLGHKPSGEGRKKRPSKEDISKMSDDELNKKISRMQREKQYYDMTHQASEGKKIAVKILTGAATAALTMVTIRQLNRLGGPQVDKLFDSVLSGVKDLRTAGMGIDLSELRK